VGSQAGIKISFRCLYSCLTTHSILLKFFLDFFSKP
jgi:hypothetical protein